MPIVNGRYHLNPTYGRLLEINRLAEAFQGLAAQTGIHKDSWVDRLIDHLTTPRSATEPPPRPRPPSMPPEAYDYMKVNQLTVKQIANIIANENRDLTPGRSSQDELRQAKLFQAHAVINADRIYGPQRDDLVRTAPKEVTASLERSPQYRDALDAARTAFEQQLSGSDPTAGRMFFNNRPDPGTYPRHFAYGDAPVFRRFGPFQLGNGTRYTIINDTPPNMPPPRKPR
jgi:hypothetical protein